MSLLEHCDSHRLGVRQRLQLFLQVCAAVEHAHQRLVVHRDLKPANVMVDEAGQVKLLDFGIAKLLDAQNLDGTMPTPVQEGGRAHTPRYAAPEQLQGLPVATVTDVYSLGVLLYELLTGALPYGDDIRSGSELARAVLEDEPIPPSRARLDAGRLMARNVTTEAALRRSLGGDLDRVVLQALRKQPAERYGSVAALALDVTRLLGHQPLVSLPTSMPRRLALFLRRHRVASAAAGLGLAVLAGLGALTWQRDQEARAQQLQSAKAREFIVELLQDADPWVGQTGSSVTALQMLDGAVLRARE
jgi:eukaryotic-like serine/threonine-protein kinase